MKTNIKRALISVSDKTGVLELAQALHKLGVEIISTGGTMKVLREAGIPVTYVSDVTGFPEIMDGRVKTLNPYIHGGILAIRDNPEHGQAMQKHGIKGIDLVVVNLYPFRQTIAKPDVTLEEAIENIDIGGPAMIRAAAKNFKFVTVVVNPGHYKTVLDELNEKGEVSFTTRMNLAREAYIHTAEYDACIAGYLAKQHDDKRFPDNLDVQFIKIADLRYGENPHQHAAFYKEQSVCTDGIANAKQLAGKELSFNNIVDLEAAYAIVAEFPEPAAAIIKHTNPCGTAIGQNISEAYQKAYEVDTVSAYGGIIGLNRPVDADTAENISKIFIEAVIAPGYTPEALTILMKKQNVRLLETKPCLEAGTEYDIKKVSGGILVQDVDRSLAKQSDMKVVTKRQPSASEWQELLFAWRVVKHVKSNAIVLSKNGQTIGVGAGQMNRVGAADIAFRQAAGQTDGAVLASDAFFPFGDTVTLAATYGIKAIIQPGGSVRDEESIKAADEHGIAMVFTGERHFKH